MVSKYHKFKYLVFEGMLGQSQVYVNLTAYVRTTYHTEQL